MNEEVTHFNYCIARPWKNNPNSLSAYALGTQLFYGTMEEAEDTRANISKRAGKEYEIYKLDNQPLMRKP